MPSTEQLQIQGPDWLTPHDVAQQFSISETMLARLRFARRGPVFVRLGHKTLLYHRKAVETFLQTLPAGGDKRLRTATAAKDGGAKKRSKISA